jgi:hypothetical protein
MDTRNISAFCKNEDCPPSDDLLAFQTGELEMPRMSDIIGHVNLCDFCAAEIEFYEHFPPIEVPSELSEIPAPLFELAAALLSNRDRGMTSLNDLLDEYGLAYDKA